MQITKCSAYAMIVLIPSDELWRICSVVYHNNSMYVYFV